MRKRTRVLLILVAAAVVATVAWFIARSPDTSKLAAFKVELRAKGEKLTWTELGYPKPEESSRARDRLLTGIGRIGKGTIEPGRLELMSFPTGGQAQVSWRLPWPPRGIAGTNQVTWAQLAADFETVADALGEIRTALTNPPARFFTDPENSLDGPRPPFVELRKAAQWLTADLVVAMQSNQKSRARSDVEAVARLAQVHRDDPTLVSQMIRTAITGLGLTATWEAMQADDWTEADLAAMQHSWEEVDLLAALDQSLVGERAFGEMGFTMARNHDPDFKWPFDQSSGRTIGQALQDSITQPYWRMHIDSDELLMLHHYQGMLEAIRRLRGDATWPDVQRELTASQAELMTRLGHPIKRLQYLLSSAIIPNTTRASATVVRNEVHRRLTVTALALERHRLGRGEYPADLKALIPEFLTAVPRDLMSTQSLSYRLNPDATFTLYSVGEDGRDDGGDPVPIGVTNRFDLWSGRDAVWPKASD